MYPPHPKEKKSVLQVLRFRATPAKRSKKFLGWGEILAEDF